MFADALSCRGKAHSEVRPFLSCILSLDNSNLDSDIATCTGPIFSSIRFPFTLFQFEGGETPKLMSTSFQISMNAELSTLSAKVVIDFQASYLSAEKSSLR
ncbi:hypothetical protein O6H91_12G064500 [Diphasiastrum complanatum]|uniref:Uncharacterized protein n=1 Tax=Diphasiastrum complanatum TaxID=34168 RepID=A0ACC2C2U1_DIPCM|nr:hypothetical protein O6H91_12G064500 [Diphasiastrum complanatum]